MSPRCLVSCLCLLGACATLKPAPPGPGAFTLAVTLLAQGPAEAAPHALAPGDGAHSGDRLSVMATVTRSAYLYVVSYQSDGWSVLLAPRQQEAAQPAGVPLLAPGPGAALVLDQRPGPEAMYVVASLRPLLEVMPAACARLRLPCLQGKILGRGDGSPPPPPPPPPVGTDPEDRGPGLAWRGARVTIPAGPQGVAWLRLPFAHLP